MSKFLKYTLIFLGLIANILSFAQQSTLEENPQSKSNELEDKTVIITIDKVNKLPQAFRTIQKADISVNKEHFEPQNYDFVDYKLKVPDIESKIRILGVKDADKPLASNALLKLGVGNYLATYAEGFYTKTIKDNILLGARANHLSWANGPSTERKSGSSNNEIMLWSNMNFSKYNFNAFVNYQRFGMYYYGFREPVMGASEKTLNDLKFRQIYNKTNITAQLLTNKSNTSDYKFTTDVAFQYLTAYSWPTESEIYLKHAGDFSLDGGAKVMVKSDFSFSKRSYKELNQNRVFFTLAPSYFKILNGFETQAGINIGLENDTLLGAKSFHLYPVIKVVKKFKNDKLITDFGIDGGLQKNVLANAITENPFLSNKVVLGHTNKNFDFFANLKGKLSNSFTFNLGASYSKYTNLPFYLNNPSQRNEFIIVYDTNGTGLTKLQAGIHYSKASLWGLGYKAEYNAYSMSKLQTAIHKPSYISTAYANYNLHNKLIFTASWYTLAGIKTLEPVLNKVQKLPIINDVNLKIDYRLSDKFSSYLEFNNLLASKYSRFLYYPTRGFFVMLGVTYKF